MIYFTRLLCSLGHIVMLWWQPRTTRYSRGSTPFP